MLKIIRAYFLLEARKHRHTGFWYIKEDEKIFRQAGYMYPKGGIPGNYFYEKGRLFFAIGDLMRALGHSMKW